MSYDARSTRNFTKALRRDHERCLYCGGEADCVDHIVPWCYSEDNSLGNLASACTPCNQAAAGHVFEDFADKVFNVLRRRGLLRFIETSEGAIVSVEPPAGIVDPPAPDYALHPGFCEICGVDAPDLRSHVTYSSRHRSHLKEMVK